MYRRTSRASDRKRPSKLGIMILLSLIFAPYALHEDAITVETRVSNGDLVGKYGCGWTNPMSGSKKAFSSTEVAQRNPTAFK